MQYHHKLSLYQSDLEEVIIIEYKFIASHTSLIHHVRALIRIKERNHSKIQLVESNLLEEISSEY